MPLDLEKLQDSPHLLDILLQMEDVLDSLDIYVFKNWFKGEVVEGPKIRRYWLSFTLKYAYKDMPDPRGGRRLLKHGIRVDFERADQEKVGSNTPSDEEKLAPVDDDTPDTLLARKGADKVWLIHIDMPRRLVSQIATSEMDFYDDEVDEDDVESARDSGMDDESAYEDPDDPNNDKTNDADDTATEEESPDDHQQK